MPITKHLILPSMMGVLVLAICAAAQATTQSQVEIIPDVIYGHKDGMALTFDVLKPKTNASGSAGGHLSLVLGTVSDNGDPNAKEDFMKESNRVASVVAYFPPVDPRPITRGVNPPPRADGKPYRFPALNFEKEKAADYSPIVHVSPDDPPTLLIHGDKDDLVPISNSKIIYEAFKKNNVKTDFITIEGAGHGFRGDDAKRASATMVAWFEQTLVKNGLKTGN